MSNVLTKVLSRQVLLAFRRPAAVLNPLVFVGVVVLMMPLGLGPERDVLGEFSPGLMWITALLASLLSVETLFRGDYDDGTLEQLVTSGHSLYFASMGYLLSHWCVAGIPLILCSGLFASMLSMPTEGIAPLMASLFAGTLVLSAFGTLGASITVALRRGGMLLSLLLLPLEVPVLVLGAGVVDRAIGGMPIADLLSIMMGLAMLALALAPIAIAASIRISLEV